MIEISRKNKMILIYNEAKKFLNNITPSDVGEKGLKEYLNIKKKYKNKNDILLRLLLSLQNRQMSKNVIALENPKRKEIFDKILFNYDSDKILNSYNEETLLNVFKDNFLINNIESRNNLWRLYAKSIISACKFICSFDSIKDFDNFVNRFNYNEMSSAALPMLLEKEVFGLGFPLACDFLKELGFSEYPKPDIHIKDIFVAFDLCENNDYSAYKAVIEMANIVKDSAYNVDKIFWLIGSGNFYMHNISIGRNKEKFINRVKEIFK
jgi:hypothetical protein